MFKVIDNITGEELTYEDSEEFRRVSKESFVKSVHGVIDELVDAYNAGQPTQGFEAFLGIEIQ